ncbi:MAG: hypothetical protein MEQ74_11745 [Paracoccus sp.]|nr:hypothetical protein [Paracoccus sp. (in: a-proteobacteria)]
MSALRQHTEPEVQGSLREALDRASVEARRIAVALAQIDEALGAMLEVTDGSAQSLQVADLLRQEVEGLSVFLALVAQQTPPDQPFDPSGAGSALDLRAQSLRLTGETRVPDHDPQDDLWGHAGG